MTASSAPLALPLPGVASADGPVVAAVDDPHELARFTRWESAAGEAGARVGVSSLQLSGMHCAACTGLIETALARVPGVITASVSAASQRATVRWDPQRARMSEVLAAVRGVGYGAVPDVAASARELRRQEQRGVLWRLFVGSFLAMQVMMLATPSYVAGPGDLAPDLAQLLNWGSWVLSIPVMWFGGMPFVQGAWQSLRRRRIGMDVPVALGLVVTFLASSAVTFEPGGIFGDEVYFDSLTMFIAFLWLGRWLEMRARHGAAQALEAALAGMPETAWRIDEDGVVREVAVARLRPGDRVRVPVGAAVPADGTLLGEAAGVTEALLTGESLPVPKRQGDTLLAGSVNAVAPLEMRVERVGADTRHEAIVALMRDALSQRPAAARVADRVAGPFLWVVLALSIGSGLFWLSLDPSRALWVAVSVLIVTCPCALSLSMPVTLVAAAGGLARRGVLLSRLDALQAFSGVRTLFLDKTGTLTLDRPTLAGVEPLDAGADAGFVLQQAAGLARWSSHPFSAALVAAAEAAGAPGPAPQGQPAWTALREQPGQGLAGVDPDGAEWRLGTAAWAADGQAAVPSPDAEVWLSRDGRPVARFRFDETLRDDAQSTMDALRADGIRLVLLSGDRSGRAQQLGRRLGIAQVLAGCSPEDKLSAVQRARQDAAPVGMVGDGINDAPVMAAADVSLAMGHGALVAQRSADAVLVSGRLSGLADLRATAARTMRIVHQNLAWSAAYNASCIPLAMIGWLPPWLAGLGMAASSVLVVLNAQRAAHPAGARSR